MLSVVDEKLSDGVEPDGAVEGEWGSWLSDVRSKSLLSCEPSEWAFFADGQELGRRENLGPTVPKFLERMVMTPTAPRIHTCSIKAPNHACP